MHEHYSPLPLRDQLVAMDIHDRNTFLLQDEYLIDEVAPGFALGDILFMSFKESDWRPANEDDAISNPLAARLPELLLFAGCTDFEGLHDFTKERIERFYEQYADGSVDMTNINKSLGMVEDLMRTEKRRTGEPAVAHIYRNVLRMIEFIESANGMYQELHGQNRFTANTADFYICLSAMHDFLEDSYPVGNNMIQRGGYRPSRTSEYRQWEDGVTFYRYLHPTGEEDKQDMVSEMSLDFGEYENYVFARNLLALNRRGIADTEIIHHLEEEIEKLKNDPEKPLHMDPLLEVAAIICKCIDRMDNNCSSPFYKNKQGKWQTMLPQKIVAKAQENMMLFRNIPQVLAELMGVSTDDLRSEVTAFLHKYDPNRWSKWVLAGLPLWMIYYSEGAGCGIPKMR